MRLVTLVAVVVSDSGSESVIGSNGNKLERG